MATLRLRIPFATLALPLLAVSFAGPAEASWTERGATISSVRELRPSLRSAFGARLQTQAADDAPVLLRSDADLTDPKALAVALIHSGLAVRPQGGGASLGVSDRRAEVLRAETRLRRVTEVAPSPGDPRAIPTGAVALFGRLIEPPFRVERAGDAIELNGVVVYPAPGPDVQGPAPTAQQIAQQAGIDGLLASYPANRARSGQAAAQAAALAAARAIPGVTSAEWVDDQNLRLVKSNGIVTDVSFADEREPSPDAAAEMRAQMDAMVTGLETVLKEGGAILCGATYLVTVPGPDGPAFRGRVGEIRASTEVEALKLARIQAWTGHRDAAADLLFAR